MPRTKEQFAKIRENTKRGILEAGLRVFATKGYHGSSVSDIAKEAGISKGLAYNYFGSKKELAEAVMMQIADVLSLFDKLFEQIDDPYELLKLSIKEMFNHLRSNEEFWQLYISFITQTEMADAARKMFGNIVDQYIKKLEKVFRQIGLNDPKSEAYMLAALLDGVPFDYLFDKEKYPLKKIEKAMLKRYSREQLELCK